ncbi:MAG: helix-turn-helix transcriptional regulator [Paludisphaera borealis]|uniref:helix-turn-helix domain-containing protein n=1 Tax=Paludisphaera borealis TaxID=1387353 RepID=UPI00283EBCEA|nr:helix-turn-helix transcriptional regulator [Paludisphaera borealis]MDR3619872.1 helix-turn-helix transcriptional regulator [Paludisphaera borealis]
MAVDVLFDRIRSLSTALEILSQAPSRSTPMPLGDDAPMKPGLKKWADHVGGKIRELRERAGLNQSELAEKAGLTQSHVSRLENAAHSATHVTLEKIATALGVPVADIDPRAD